jgi:signal transduction histidine kinase
MSQVTSSVEENFQADLKEVNRVQTLRDTTLKELSDRLLTSPRIHAALEDDALDLLYLITHDEFREVLRDEDEPGIISSSSILRAKFYRFLDSKGSVIRPPDNLSAGKLSQGEEAQLDLPGLLDRHQLGYLLRSGPQGFTVDEIVTLPIFSTQTGKVIAALVLGFPTSVGSTFSADGMVGGIFLHGQLVLPGLPAAIHRPLSHYLDISTASHFQPGAIREISTPGGSYLLSYQRINPGSLYPPAYEVGLYKLDRALRWKHILWYEILGVGALLMIAGAFASHLLASRFSVSVEQLESESMEERSQRKLAEAALQLRSLELGRAVRFSADASHQLKTPLTVLRAGLEALLARHSLGVEIREELAALVHQTFRLNGVIEDLLLLSRMDAGCLRVNLTSVDLTAIIEGFSDDLTALPDAPTIHLEMSSSRLEIAGEKRYIELIMQNLLENAWKYNRPGGEIRIRCFEDGKCIKVVIGNTGPQIPCEARETIFERFHRAAIGENIPGHGLGLNLARELAVLHGGDVILLSSEGGWTEFQVSFPAYASASLKTEGEELRLSAVERSS